MLAVARTLVKAFRTGSSDMHLGGISKCLPIFAAAGHFNYLKSAYLYLPDMTQLWSANSERCCMLYDEVTDTGCDFG